MTHPKVPVAKENMPSRITPKEFAGTKLANSSKLKKCKEVKRPVTYKGKPTSTTSELPHVPKTSPYVTTDDVKEEKKQNDKLVYILAVLC